MTDIRLELQAATSPSRDLDHKIAKALNYIVYPDYLIPSFTTDYNFSIKYIESRGCDWIMALANDGVTPYATVGNVKDCYGITPLLSLWLAYTRLLFGDERVIDSRREAFL